VAADRELLRELMSVPPGEFVATRTRLVRGGARDLAKLRKPPLRLWAANRALAARPDAAGRLEAAMRRLRQLEAAIAAGERAAGAQLREAGADSKRELDTLESEAAQHAPGVAAEARELIRRAAVEGGRTWEDLRDGVLLEEPSTASDAVFALATASLPEPRRAAAERTTERRQRETEVKRLQAEARRLDEEATRLEEEAHRARDRAAAAAARASEADRSR
jgi:hypothetical protein